MTSNKKKLFFPLQGGNYNKDAASDFQILDQEANVIVDHVHGENNAENLLSHPLVDQFAKMRALLRKDSYQLAGIDLKRKQRKVALETAFTIHNEVSRLESAIAELEGLQRRRTDDAIQRKACDQQHAVLIQNSVIKNSGEEEGEIDDRDANIPLEGRHDKVLQFPYLRHVVLEKKAPTTEDDEIENETKRREIAVPTLNP